MKEILLVGLGSSVGGILRYTLSVVMLPLTVNSYIPWATLLVNVAGSLLIGFLISLEVPQAWHYLCIVGFCGGFTTFSAFSLELLTMFRVGNWLAVVIYILTSLVLSLVAVAAGYFLGIKFNILR